MAPLGGAQHGGVVTELSIMVDVSKSMYSQQHNVQPEDLAIIWKHVFNYVCLSLKAARTVLLPGLGTFRVCHRLHANTVYPTEALYPVFQFHPRFTAQQQDPIPNAGYPVDGAGSPPDFDWLEARSGLPAKRTKRLFYDMVRALAKAILAGRSISVECDSVGKVERTQKEKVLRFTYYSDILWPPMKPDQNPVVTGLSPRKPAASAGAAKKPATVRGYILGDKEAEHKAFLDSAMLPPGLLRVWEACLREDKVKHGFVKRLLFERFLQTSSRAALKVIGGTIVLDLMEEHCCGKQGDFVRYQPLLLALVDYYYANGGDKQSESDGAANGRKKLMGAISDSKVTGVPPDRGDAYFEEPIDLGTLPKGFLAASGHASHKVHLSGPGCMVQADPDAPPPKPDDEIFGLAGPKRYSHSPYVQVRPRVTETAVGYHHKGGVNQVGYVDWEVTVPDKASRQSMNAWNLEHSRRVRRMRADKGVTPKPNSAHDATQDIMISDLWAEPPPPAYEPPRDRPPSRQGALATLAGETPQEYDWTAAVDPCADPARHFIVNKTTWGGKFEGELGRKDEELVGRVRPSYAGFKRPGSERVALQWAERREVDDYNRLQILDKQRSQRAPAAPSSAEQAYVPGGLPHDGWGGLTPKPNQCGWGTRFETTCSARR